MKKYLIIPLLTLSLYGCSSSNVIPYSSPPPTISSLEKNNVSYEGALPCNNCDAINLSIDLHPDSETFSLNASYVNHPQNMPDENYEGKWAILRGTTDNSNAIVYKLTPYSDGQEYFFLRLNRNQLELVSPARARFERNEQLRITRSSYEDNGNKAEDTQKDIVSILQKEAEELDPKVLEEIREYVYQADLMMQSPKMYAGREFSKARRLYNGLERSHWDTLEDTEIRSNLFSLQTYLEMIDTLGAESYSAPMIEGSIEKIELLMEI